MLFCSADETSFTAYMRPTICVIYSDGSVRCVPPSRHTASCSADLTRWPYDTHTCDLVLGSWTHTGEKVNISLMKPSVRIQFTHSPSYKRYSSLRDIVHFHSEELLDFTIEVNKSWLSKTDKISSAYRNQKLSAKLLRILSLIDGVSFLSWRYHLCSFI
jgi:hypothetical protein